jgi:hypothetical protein
MTSRGWWASADVVGSAALAWASPKADVGSAAWVWRSFDGARTLPKISVIEHIERHTS